MSYSIGLSQESHQFDPDEDYHTEIYNHSEIDNSSEVDLYDNIEHYTEDDEEMAINEIVRDPDEVIGDDFIDQSRVQNSSDVKGFLEELNCSICCHIIINPRVCQKCEALFCLKCIQEWFEKKNRKICPCCRATPSDVQQCPYSFMTRQQQDIMSPKVPKLLKSLLSKLLLRCKNETQGCDEIITYDFRIKHESQFCQHAILNCINQGCDLKILRKDFQEHMTECPYGLVPCKFCADQYARYEIDIHLSNCDYRLVQCKWCRMKYSYIDLDEHQTECPMKKVLCQYCQGEFYLELIKIHTPISCLKQQVDVMASSLEVKKLEVATLNDQLSVSLIKITDQNTELKKYEVECEQYKQDALNYQQLWLESQKQLLQYERNQSTEEKSKEYTNDFEPDEEEIKEEIIIEDDDTVSTHMSVNNWLLNLLADIS